MGKHADRSRPQRWALPTAISIGLNAILLGMVLRLLATPPAPAEKSFAVELKGVRIVRRTPVDVERSKPKPEAQKSFFQKLLSTVRPEPAPPAPRPESPRPVQPVAPRPAPTANKPPLPTQPTPVAPTPAPVRPIPAPTNPVQPVALPSGPAVRNDGGGSAGGSGGTTATGPGAGSGSGGGSGNISVGGGGSGDPSGSGGGSGSGHGSGQGTGHGEGDGHENHVAHEAPPPQPERPPAPRGETRAARILNQSKPGYPSDARDDGVEGTATLLVTVDENGRVSSVRLERSAGDKRLDRAAEQAVRQWTYSPSLKDGVAETATIRVRVQFRLE